MPENVLKLPRSVSPAAGSGAGDISERELSRERHYLQTTPARVQLAHPNKQLFSVPVNKFTAKVCQPSPNLARIRSCLHEYKKRAPVTPVKMSPKSISMEDLTPTKRRKKERNDNEVPVVRSPVHSVAEKQSAVIVSRFMLIVAWRRRREEVKCLRKTLQSQVSCSERLRIQVITLKSLLDSDNAKVLLAMRELERLKQLLRDKDLEKAVLEREKLALENDISVAEDRASELSIGWRNTRNELESVRSAGAESERAVTLQRAATEEARAQRDRAYHRLSMIEEQQAQSEELLSAAEAEVAALRTEAETNKKLLDDAMEQLRIKQEAQEHWSSECEALGTLVSLVTQESDLVKGEVEELRTQLGRVDAELQLTREQLAWWPEPLTRILGVARTWIRYPISWHEALRWTLLPARSGC